MWHVAGGGSHAAIGRQQCSRICCTAHKRCRQAGSQKEMWHHKISLPMGKCSTGLGSTGSARFSSVRLGPGQPRLTSCPSVIYRHQPAPNEISPTPAYMLMKQTTDRIGSALDTRHGHGHGNMGDMGLVGRLGNLSRQNCPMLVMKDRKRGAQQFSALI